MIDMPPLTAAEHPELWAFLEGRRPGERLSGTVAAIERFGVFADLDEGPRHPVHPGVGFITRPELSWYPLDDPSDAVRVGQRVTCEFLQFDTMNGEARLSLRATRPDPFRAFARVHRAGDVLEGTVTKAVPFGVFVRVAGGVEGLLRDVPDGNVRTGDAVAVVVGDIDVERRRVAFSGWCEEGFHDAGAGRAGGGSRSGRPGRGPLRAERRRDVRRDAAEPDAPR
ncbi:S1 RNA-binding domain-containing protein [Actinomadura sp. LD22]|uniref:S1 RNA-binding domain-containing protein n=1 Tax=Actinomadura physcomitrii TaxID=2650748 RepID=A0A6I4M1V6_9ACTN|nr:S1 RNA-binding domain-containing protein [Actinomadura physcomitrii]MVZ99099.1 S1 RNA-binding domain-containing protein [Actinomadura physcomitrii]